MHRNVCESRCKRRCDFAGCDHRSSVVVLQGSDSYWFRLVSKTLRTEEWAVLAVDAIPSAHVRSDISLQQPLQTLSVPVCHISRHRFWLLFLPVRETCEHVLRRHRLLTHARRGRLHAHNHAAVIVHQIVVVITEPSWCATLSRVFWHDRA